MARSSAERLRVRPRRFASVASSSCCVVRWRSVASSCGMLTAIWFGGGLAPASWMTMRGGGVALACSTGFGAVAAAAGGVVAGFFTRAVGLGFGFGAVVCEAGGAVCGSGWAAGGGLLATGAAGGAATGGACTCGATGCGLRRLKPQQPAGAKDTAQESAQ